MNDFAKTMHEIKEHYKSSTTPYKFKTTLRASNAPLPEDVMKTQNDFKSQNTDFSNSQQNSITESSKKYTDSKNYDDFKARMEKNREEAKKRADAFIDEYTNKMIAAGDKHPEHQESIASICESTLQFFSQEVMKKIADFVADVVNNIVKWVKEVFQKIKDTFLSVENAIANFF